MEEVETTPEDRLMADVQEGLRLYQEGRRAEWEALSFWDKVAELWSDLPGTVRVIIVLPPLMVLGCLVALVVAMVAG